VHNKYDTIRRGKARQHMSARRTSAYDRSANGSLLPEQFFDSRVKLAAVCPETALMYAVLENAFLCFHKQFEPDRRFSLSARQAEDWFFSDDSRGLFSFMSICNVLGLEPRYIRTKLQHWIAP
jgi:hypothetical protein